MRWRSASPTRRSPRSSSTPTDPHPGSLTPDRSAAQGRRRSADHRLVDLLAGGADRELLGIASRSPLLAAQRAHGLAGDRRLEDLVLLHVVREALVVARLEILFLEKFFQFAIKRCHAALIGAVQRSTHAVSLIVRALPRAACHGRTPLRGLDELHETLAAAVVDATSDESAGDEHQHPDAEPDPERDHGVLAGVDQRPGEQPDRRDAEHDRADEGARLPERAPGCRALRLLERAV